MNLFVPTASQLAPSPVTSINKQGIDFEAAQRLWADAGLVEFPAAWYLIQGESGS
jgi:hypothetical protein